MNFDFDAFTYITGTASLLGLLLQFKDIFPEHRDLRKSIVLLVIGVFVGSAVASLKGVKVEFGASVDPFEVLVGVFATVLAVVAITGSFTQDSTRRAALFSFSGVGTVALFILLVFGKIGSLDQNKINVQELLELSTLYESHGNYDRALFFLVEAKSRIPVKDERRKILDERIRDLRGKQIGAK